MSVCVVLCVEVNSKLRAEGELLLEKKVRLAEAKVVGARNNVGLMIGESESADTDNHHLLFFAPHRNLNTQRGRWRVQRRKGGKRQKALLV